MNIKSILSYFSIKYWIVYLWIIALTIYFGHMYFENGPITKYAQGIVDVINLFCFATTIIGINNYSGYAKKIIKVLSFLTIIFIIYTLIINESISVSGASASSVSQLKLLLFSTTSIFPPLFFHRKGLLDVNIVKVSFLLFMLMSYLTFFSFRVYLQDLNGVEDSVNNMGYLIVSLFPLCYLCKNPIRYLYWGLCLFLVFLGAKRGALLLGLTLVVVSIIFTVSNVKLYKKVIFLCSVICVLYYFFIYFGDNFIYTLNRLQDSGFESHSRQDIQSNVIEGFMNGNPIHWIIGYGPVGSLHLASNFAHNDWLEILVCYGIIGFIPYFLFYANLFKFWNLVRNENHTISFILLTALISCLYKSMLSMCFYSIENCVLMYAIGVAIAEYQSNEDFMYEKNTFIH